MRRPTGSRESQEQSPGPRGARDPAPARPHAADPRSGPGAATGRERAQFEGTGGSPSFRPRVGGVTSNSPHETTSPPLGRHRGASGFLETAPWQRLPCGDVTSHGLGRAPGAGPRAGKLELLPAVLNHCRKPGVSRAAGPTLGDNRRREPSTVHT